MFFTDGPLKKAAYVIALMRQLLRFVPVADLEKGRLWRVPFFIQIILIFLDKYDKNS